MRRSALRENRVNDYERIRRLLAEYCHLCDDARFQEWAELFVPGGSFTAFGRTHKGHEALASFIASAPLGKHLCFNAVIDTKEDEATCVSDFVFFNRARELSSVGRYVDVLTRNASDWCFVSRSVEMMPKE